MRDSRGQSEWMYHTMTNTERYRESKPRKRKAGLGDNLLKKKWSSVSHFDVRVSNVVGMNGAEALQCRGGERDTGRATDVLLPFQLTNAPLENTREEFMETEQNT